MSLEEQLAAWTEPSSATEQDKQDRTERMIRDAVANHRPFSGCDLRVFAKGSYANNTNVRADSDVDIAVECREAIYWEEASPGAHPASTPYKGIWTPELLRSELEAALHACFPRQVDASGSTAIAVHSGTARVDADVVPCFTYKYYFSPTSCMVGTRIVTKTGAKINNYPDQQLVNGRQKNKDTGSCYKKVVRILKRVENAMLSASYHRSVPSYFIECLVYNCPNDILCRPTWTETIRETLRFLWTGLRGDEPSNGRWLEVNECFYLFRNRQKWTRADGRDFVKAAWNYLDYK